MSSLCASVEIAAGGTHTLLFVFFSFSVFGKKLFLSPPSNSPIFPDRFLTSASAGNTFRFILLYFADLFCFYVF